MKTITIRWEPLGTANQSIKYFIDDFAVGVDDEGFEKILDTIRTLRDTRVVLKIQHISALGGESFRNALPFRKRFAELEAMLGDNKLVYEFG